MKADERDALLARIHRLEKENADLDAGAVVLVHRVAELETVLRHLLPWAGRQTFENDAVWVAARAALTVTGNDGAAANG